MPVETWLTFTLGFMVIGSIVALEIKDILSSIIAIGIVGLAVSVSFLFLQAPDLAIVQFLFEIFALIILVRAFISKENHEMEPVKAGKMITAISILVLIAIFAGSIQFFRLMPAFGDPILGTAAHYLENGAVETGAANLVSSIILDYRAYDTLGEVTVLFTAILGTITILRIRTNSKQTGGTES